VALDGRHDDVLISTKATNPVGDGPNDRGSSRLHLVKAVEASLTRLRTDHVDLLYMHAFDATTAVEEVVRALDDLVSAGKVRYVGASNFSGWQLMKALAVADRQGRSRYVAHQVQYSLAVRDYEHELMPLGIDQGVGGVVWSPLGGAALTGKIRRGQPVPSTSRLGDQAAGGLAADPELIYDIVDALDEIAAETGRSLSQLPQISNLALPTIPSPPICPTSQEQVGELVGALDWSLDRDQRERLDRASASPLPYPYRQQRRSPDFLAASWTPPM
jgi:aryl-alcohol dehydrogenase-like predicted oxidoreductase